MKKSTKVICRKFNKIIAVITAAIIFSLIPCSVMMAAESNTMISKTVDIEAVTSGVIHKTITEFTSEGWLSINILQVDLTNPNVKLDALTNTSNSTQLTTVKSIANSNSAIAAVNANYFFGVGGTTASAIGPAMSNGEIVSMTSGFNSTSDSMATFALNSSKIPQIDYWKTDISLISSTGAEQSVSNYNRMSNYNFRDIIVLDKNYGKMSLGASEKYPDLVEMVVSDGVVKEIRIGQPAVEIPKNGFVAVSRSSDTNFLIKSFQVGSTAVLNVKSSIDWKNVDVAVSGSSVLLKDGAIPLTFSFNDVDNGIRNPRTMIGSTKDAKTLFIVAVDGRQKASIGMTLTEAAQFMQSIGAYNALNLDGGSSTTMVSRPLGYTYLSAVNTPSDGARGVITALGIISTAPASSLAGLVIESDDSNVFVNTTRKLTVRGYDKYYNPVEVNPASINWSVSGVSGSVKKESTYAVFKANSVGEAVITASIGKVKKTINISSLSTPVKLELNDTSIKTPIGTNSAISVTGYNVNGYSAMLNTADLHFNVVSKPQADSKKTIKIGSVNAKGEFVPENSGTGYIDVSIAKVHVYCAVSVRYGSYPVKDDFESEIDRSFTTYSPETGGSFELTNNVAYDGKASAKLSYNFAASENYQSVYINYPDNSIAIDAGYDYIGVYVNIPKDNTAAANTGNSIRAEVIDGDGKSNLLTLSSEMNWTGWKYLQASISNIKGPAYIKRLYVVRTAKGASQGYIYIDRLLLKKTWYSSVDTSSIPKDTVSKDSAMVSGSSFKASSSSLRFTVFGQSSEPSTNIEKTLVKNYTAKIKNMDISAVVGDSSHAFTKELKKLYIATKDSSNAYTVKNSLFVQLDMHTGSLRTSQSGQWSKLQVLLSNTKAQNVFLFLSGAPDEMSDKMEAKLFKDTLSNYKKTTKKNIWVFYNGSTDTTYMDKGVKYISSCGYAVKNLSAKTVSSAKYYLITVKGSKVTYELKAMN